MICIFIRTYHIALSRSQIDGENGKYVFLAQACTLSEAYCAIEGVEWYDTTRSERRGEIECEIKGPGVVMSKSSRIASILMHLFS